MTAQGRWVCIFCKHVNPPHRYYCFGCPARRDTNDGLGRMKEIIDRYETDMSAAELGYRFAISAERVRQIYRKGKRLEKQGLI